MWAVKMLLCFIITLTLTHSGLGKDCKSDNIAWDYTGPIDKTKNGNTCFDWFNMTKFSTTAEWLHNDDFPSGSRKDAGSMCRNPDKSDGGPWCYYAWTGFLFTLKSEQCDIPWCSKSDGCLNLKQIAPASSGGHVSCKSLGGGSGVPSLEACHQLTCHLGGNAFNFKGSDCYAKSCTGDNYSWSDTDGYDVYAINMCAASEFKMAISMRAMDMASGCPLVASAHKINVEACKQLACAKGGNIFNYKDDSCYIKRCEPSTDWKLFSDLGNNIYYLDTCENSFKLSYSASDGKAIDCPHAKCITALEVQSCLTYACAEGYNAFNFNNDENTCCIQQCDSRDLKLTEKKGYDVYIKEKEKGTCSTNFKLVSPMSDGKMTDCTYVTGFDNVDLEFCKDYACANHYNAFNFKDNSCVIKQCESVDDLKLHDTPGGYDVYAMETADGSIILAYPESEGKATNCPLVKCVGGINLQQCKTYVGTTGNAVNFKDNYCCVKQCKSIDDLQLTKSMGGYEIYIKGTCQAGFKLKYPQSAGKAIGCQESAVFDGATLEACKQYVCIKGYNAFNFNKNSCIVHKCASTGDLHLTEGMGGFDIYVMDECSNTNYKLAMPSSDGKSTGCAAVGFHEGVSLEECEKHACAKESNVFNFQGNRCSLRKCASLADLQLTDAFGGYNIYVTDDGQPGRRGASAL